MEIFDNYEHVDSNCMYIVENIESASTEGKLDVLFTKGCKCEAICSINTCSCLQRSGGYYINSKADIDKGFILSRSDSSGTPIYECNNSCSCTTLCGNRLVQFGPRSNLKIVTTKAKGFGLVTLINIEAKSFICEYAGELLSPTEAEKRNDVQLKQNEVNYILYVKEHFGKNEMCTIIDPRKFGNIGRYINHSCNPNCEIIPIRVNNDVPKMCLFTKRIIEGNEELTYDYGDGNLGFKVSEDNLKNKIKCRCGEQCCRQYLPYCDDFDGIL